MYIEYEERPGDMQIFLETEDLDRLHGYGFCLVRDGLVGIDTKTWVRNDQDNQAPEALIDSSSDVYVHLPSGEVDLPVRVETPEIDPFTDDDRSRVDFYFGALGGIVVRAAEVRT